jgi:hypothetical protein
MRQIVTKNCNSLRTTGRIIISGTQPKLEYSERGRDLTKQQNLAIGISPIKKPVKERKFFIPGSRDCPQTQS